MEIDKSIGVWYKSCIYNPSYLDDLSYYLYCLHQQKNKSLMESQFGFMLLSNRYKLSSYLQFYDKSKLIIRSEKIKKIIENFDNK